MELRRLGRSDLRVSAIGLGTMTWGQQNTEDEAHAQLDLALDHGVNLVDTAEMYPVPPRAETTGRTEAYVGSWLARTGRRHEIVLASKIAGPSRGMTWIRGGTSRLVEQELVAACEASLKRLRTDFLDLYQLHWPDRSVPMFGKAEYRHDPREQATPIEETLRGLERLVRDGKVRYVGVSNETPWGVARFVSIAEATGLPRIVSVQNAYNLLNRTFELGLAEHAMRDDVPLLAYSPLAMGLLTGKYEGGRTWPPDARLTLFERFTRYTAVPLGQERSELYVRLAREHGLDPAQLALAFVTSREFVASNLIGATTLDQLRTNLGSIDVRLSDEVLAGIEAIHRASPNPCP
jgi:aryl-alcohol dehydrogenase-like predicted oxidoreductase